MVKSSKGFSLIELLVTISILTILALVAAMMYIGSQQGARDAQRQVDILNLVKAIETVKGSQPSYGGLMTSTNQFSTNTFPRDPLSSQSYCASPTASSTTASPDPTSNWGTSCPTGFVSVNNTAYTAPSQTSQIKFCAWLEKENKAFCRITVQ